MPYIVQAPCQRDVADNKELTSGLWIQLLPSETCSGNSSVPKETLISTAIYSFSSQVSQHLAPAAERAEGTSSPGGIPSGGTRPGIAIPMAKRQAVRSIAFASRSMGFAPGVMEGRLVVIAPLC